MELDAIDQLLLCPRRILIVVRPALRMVDVYTAGIEDIEPVQRLINAPGFSCIHLPDLNRYQIYPPNGLPLTEVGKALARVYQDKSYGVELREQVENSLGSYSSEVIIEF